MKNSRKPKHSSHSITIQNDVLELENLIDVPNAHIDKLHLGRNIQSLLNPLWKMNIIIIR